jgi:hypothetical protein
VPTQRVDKKPSMSWIIAGLGVTVTCFMLAAVKSKATKKVNKNIENSFTSTYSIKRISLEANKIHAIPI